MKIAERIERKVLRMPAGNVFRYRELGIAPQEYNAAAKAIERLLKKELIRRASTGVFYRPQQTAFGILEPKEKELLQPYLFEGNKRIAYVTGTSLYNQMGLTTQVSAVVKVASRDKRIVTQVGSLQVKPIKSYVDVTDENFHLLEMLDVIKDFKAIPDLDRSQVIQYLLRRIKELSIREKKKFIKIAIKYPPRVRAFTGALFEALYKKEYIVELERSLNPFTTFNFGITKRQLLSIENWNIY